MKSEMVGSGENGIRLHYLDRALDGDRADIQFQNLTSVSTSLLGMVTGGALFGPVRSWILDD